MRDNPGPRAVLNALERLAKGYDHHCDRLRQHIAVKQRQLKDFQERLGKPLAHAEYISQLADLRDRLKIRVTRNPKQEGPSVAELAKHIKALRSTSTIDAAPERTGVRKKTAAETPVKSRIKRTEEAVILAETPVPEALPAPVPIPEPTQDPEPNFAHRIVQGRKPVQLSLF